MAIGDDDQAHRSIFQKLGSQVKQAVILTLPYPPSGNHMWKHSRAGQHYLTQQAKAYYNLVAEVVRKSGHGGLLTGKLHVECDIYPPDNRRRDIDNCFKVIGDACTKAGVWKDDTQINRLVLERMETVKHGLIAIRVATIND